MLCAAGQGAEQGLPARSDGGHESDEAEELEVSVPCLEDFEDWPDAPVMVCADQAAVHQVSWSGVRLDGASFATCTL